MSGEKTEQPTPKRLDTARRRGDVPRSRDLVAFASLSAAVAVLGGTSAEAYGLLAASVRDALAAASGATRAAEALDQGLRLAAALLLPTLVATMLVAGAVAYLDAGPVFAPARVAPKLERLDPWKGLSQLFSRERLLELVKSVVVLCCFLGAAYGLERDALPELARLPRADVGAALAVSGRLTVALLERALAICAIVAVLDLALSRSEFLRSQRMSKDEVRREYKESEGDPQLRGERARLHRELVEHAMVESVRKASVLVVNPTHLAIALHFDVESDQEAPEVVAKGEDHVALRMIEVAREAGVPVLRDIPLARGLYALELGEVIPERLFEAVAAVLRAADAEREETART